jgi:hypothetical protein
VVIVYGGEDKEGQYRRSQSDGSQSDENGFCFAQLMKVPCSCSVGFGQAKMD